jgi:hypothetical protein
MGKGGLRFGAGRPGYRAKADQLCRVNVCDLRKHGRLQSDGAFPWSWSNRGRTVATITIRVIAGQTITLTYRITIDDKAEDYSIPVRLLKCPCNYGGSRYWFGCPFCAKRVGVLYLRFKRFACRHCQQVAHTSQSEDSHARQWRKTAKLDARLGVGQQRPKGMRYTTYDRLHERLFECELRREELLEAMMPASFRG